MADTNVHTTHHHHHHEHNVDNTTEFHEHMFGRSKRKKLMVQCLWYAGVAVAIALAMCLVYAYVIDK